MSIPLVAALALVAGRQPCRSACSVAAPISVLRYTADSDPVPAAVTSADPAPKPDAQAIGIPPIGPQGLLRAPALARPDHFVWKQRPSLRFGKAFRLDFLARLSHDIEQSNDGAGLHGLSGFDFRQARFGIDGSLFQRLDFQIEREPTAKSLTEAERAAGLISKSPWKDVYLDANLSKGAQVRAGKFKVPFGLDALGSQTENDFANRSLGAEYLAPGRDIGVMLHGRFFKHGLTYSAGMFERDGEHARAKSIEGGGRTFAARVVGQPFRLTPLSALDRVEVGAAYARSDVAESALGPNGLRGRTVLTQDVFFSPVYVRGQRERWEADVDWLIGPASLRGEYTFASDDRLGQGLDGSSLPDARYRSWYASGTYLVTGETKDRPVRPQHDFLRGGIGAIELAARYERIWYDSAASTGAPSRSPRAAAISPSAEFATTVGVNWFLNRWVTLQVNAIREYLVDSVSSPVPGAAAFWSRVLHLRLAL